MSDLSSLGEIEMRGSAVLRSLSSPPDNARFTGFSTTSSTVSSLYSPRTSRRRRTKQNSTLLGAAARDYTRAHGRAGRGHGVQAYSVYNDIRDSWVSSSASSSSLHSSVQPHVLSNDVHDADRGSNGEDDNIDTLSPLRGSELRSRSDDIETTMTLQRRQRQYLQANKSSPHRRILSGNTTLDKETLPEVEATLRQQSFTRHKSTRVQRAWCQISRMVGMDDITFQADDNAVDDAFATTTLVERAIDLENQRNGQSERQRRGAEMKERREKSNAKAAKLLGIAMIDRDDNKDDDDDTRRAAGKGLRNTKSRNKPESRCKFHHIKCLLIFLLVKKFVSVIVALMCLTLWIMAHMNGTLPMLSMYMPSGILYIILGIFFVLLLVVTCFVRRKGTSPMMSIAIFFVMMGPLLLPDPLSSIVLFCIVLSYCFFRKDIRARTLSTMVADFVMLVVNVYSMSFSFAVWGDMTIHTDNRTATPIGGFWGSTTELELESAHVVLRAICSSISLAIVLADLIRIKIGLSSGRMVNGGVSEVRRWITYQEIVNSNYLDTLDLIVESEINHWTSHVQHFFARSAWTHVAMIIRDPPRSVLKAYGLLKYAREMPEHAHLFVFEAVRPSVRLTPLREYMRYKQEISAYKVIGVRKLHMDRKRGINWPELEQFMLDLSTTNFVVGPLAMVKANYQLNADTVDELASINAVQSATLPTPYSRHFLGPNLPVDLDEGNEYVLDIASATGHAEEKPAMVGEEISPLASPQLRDQQKQEGEAEIGKHRDAVAGNKEDAQPESKSKSDRETTDRFSNGSAQNASQGEFLGWTSSRKKVVGVGGQIHALGVAASQGALPGNWDNDAQQRHAYSKLNDQQIQSWLSVLAMRRARKEEDLQDTPGIFCSQMTAMAYKVAGVMYREYEHPLVRGSANYTPHDWGDHNDELQLGLRFGAWHSKEVVRIRADSRFAMRRLRKKNFDGVGEIVATPMGPALLLDHRPALEGADAEGFAVCRMCHFGAVAWFPVSQIYPESRTTVKRYAEYNCREQYAWWLPFEEGGEFDYTAKGKGKHWHAVRD